MSSSSSTTPADGRPARQSKNSAFQSAQRAIVAWALFSLWLLLMGMGFASAIEPDWLKHIAHAGREVESRDYCDYADNLLHRGNYQHAIALYRQALAVKPDLTAASVNMAIAYERLGDPETAVRILKQALQAPNGRRGLIFFHLARIAEDQGKSQLAIELYGQTFGTEFPPQITYTKLGNLYIREQRYQDAISVLETALSMQENPASLYQEMLRSSLLTYAEDTTNAEIIAAALSTDNDADALRHYDIETIYQTLSQDQDISGNYANLGTAYAQIGETGRAIEFTQKALQIWPGNSSARRNLAQLNELRNNPISSNSISERNQDIRTEDKSRDAPESVQDFATR